MRRICLLLMILLLAGCGRDPLSEKVAELEARIEGMEESRETERQALLARLDRIEVTSENAEEIGNIRGKLTEVSVSDIEVLVLKTRVDTLERQAADWSNAASSLSRSVYAVLHGTTMADGNTTMTFIGTAFAVESKRLVTNAHIVDGLLNLDNQVRTFNNRFGTTISGRWLLVRNLTTTLRTNINYFLISSYARHPDWTGNVVSPDVGILDISGGGLIFHTSLISTAESYTLKVGQRIATLGFPGELQGGSLNDLFPIATFKDGTVSAIRPPTQGEPYEAADTYIIQHNLDLSGGTSGSPIFNLRGEVVALNNAGIENLVLTLGGTPARVSQAALGFGIRVDKIHEVLAQVPAAKPIAAPSTSGGWPGLEGKDTASITVHPYRGGTGLRERLESWAARPRP